MARNKQGAKLVAGIDLGGTNMQIGVVNARNTIVGRVAGKTLARQGAEAVIDRIVDAVGEACARADVTIGELDAVGIACPGAIDIPRGIVLEAPNLKWYDLPLRATLQRKLRRRVIVDNDVNGAVWAEFRLGAGRTASRNPTIGDVLGVWIGTGVGGGLVIGGKLFYGAYFTAGEVGHAVLFPDGDKDRQTVEDFCSRTGMSRTILQRLPQHPDSILAAGIKQAGKIVTSETLAEAYKRSDKLATEVVSEAADLLGIAIANSVTVLALDTVIIGGGVAEALGRPFLKRITRSFKGHVFPKRSQACRLVMTELKDDAGLLGAALLARESLLA